MSKLSAPSLVQPSIRDPRHLAYETLYRDQLSAFDPRKFLLYCFVEPSETEPGSPPAQALAYLARQFSVAGADGWNLAQTKAEQRDLIQNALLLHRTKGTAGGLEAALSRVGYPSARVHERLGDREPGASSRRDGSFLHSGYLLRDGRTTPGSRGWALFRVTLDFSDFDRARGRMEDLRAVIESYKRACCHLSDFRFRMEMPIEAIDARLAPPTLRFFTSHSEVFRPHPCHDGAQKRGMRRRLAHDGTPRPAAQGQIARASSPLRPAPRYALSMGAQVQIKLSEAFAAPTRRGQGILRRDGRRCGFFTDRLTLANPDRHALDKQNASGGGPPSLFSLSWRGVRRDSRLVRGGLPVRGQVCRPCHRPIAPSPSPLRAGAVSERGGFKAQLSVSTRHGLETPLPRVGGFTRADRLWRDGSQPGFSDGGVTLQLKRNKRTKR